VLLQLLIQTVQSCFFVLLLPFLGHLLHIGNVAVFVIPALGGLLAGPLIYFFAREAKGHGVPEVMHAIKHKESIIRPRVALIKAVASAICIGSGGAAGREGPMVQIGATLGSTYGQLFALSAEQKRILVAAGAAGGVAAAFHAPIAGVFFAMEIILQEFTIETFGLLVFSSALATFASQIFLGTSPILPISPQTLLHADFRHLLRIT
jgi:CIC family chloride channel protein